MGQKKTLGDLVFVHWNADEAQELAGPLRAAGWRVDTGSFELKELKANPPAAVVISLRRLPSHEREVADALWYTRWGRAIPIVFFDGAPDKVEATRKKFPDGAVHDLGRAAVGACPSQSQGERRMNWKLIARLAGFGVLMGVASVLGFTTGIEGFLWLVIGLICLGAIVWKAPGRSFQHGFLVGLVGGAVAPLIRFLFFSSYMANNPELSARFSDIPGGLGARYFVLVLAPIIGLVSGFVLGLACRLLANLTRKRRVAASS